MSIEQIIIDIKKLSNDEAAKDAMVCQLWSDGEVTLQKGGDLLGQRTLHCIQPAVLPMSHPVHTIICDEMPHKASNGFGFIYCNNTEEAAKVREKMRLTV